MLVLGCGYIGRRVARHYRDQGETVTGVVRSAGSVGRLAAEGINPLRLDLGLDRLNELPLAGNRVFHFAPPPAQGVQDVHTRRLVAAFGQQGPPRRLVYISTTGVYGNCEGAWVDENWPVQPQADRACRRWDAEQVLRGWCSEEDGELVILRVAGIYGPGRLPLDRIRKGLPLIRAEEAPYSNRIHADDLVRVCIAAMERGRNGAVYNVCDGHPSTMTDYFFRVADAAGLQRPPVIPLRDAEDALSPGMMSYLNESRRLSNRRIREELAVELAFPTLDKGLPSCFHDDGLHP
jgi:nucleoside-diphosphate-sugar epimerase